MYSHLSHWPAGDLWIVGIVKYDVRIETKLSDVSDIKLLSESNWNREALENTLGEWDICLFGTASIAKEIILGNRW